VETDMTAGTTDPRSDQADVACTALDDIEKGQTEILVNDISAAARPGWPCV
jgi:hypothetical protein